MLVDYWANKHADDPNIQEPMETENFDDEVAAMEAHFAAMEQAAELPEEDWAPVVADRFGGAP
jgi:hypothetical protein